MKRITRTLVALTALVGVAACAKPSPPTSAQIFTLHPYPHEGSGKPASAEQSFHDYRVLGRAELSDPAERSKVATVIADAEKESEGMAAACFNPRHGVRLKRGTETIDYVICFECLQMKEYRGGKERTILVARRPERALDEVLAQHGLKKYPN